MMVTYQIFTVICPFLPHVGGGLQFLINYGGVLTIQHILSEPVNEVLRIASGYDTGNPPVDNSNIVMVFWGILILIILLNIFILGYLLLATLAL